MHAQENGFGGKKGGEHPFWKKKKGKKKKSIEIIRDSCYCAVLAEGDFRRTKE